MARIAAKVLICVPYFCMCSRPAPPNWRRAIGTPTASAVSSSAIARCLLMIAGRSLNTEPRAPGCICSKPRARAHSTAPLSTAWRARNSALEPVEQLLLTFTTGTPLMPTS
ncbi:hypothetical protein D9M70_632280 [compost metagenome]